MCKIDVCTVKNKSTSTTSKNIERVKTRFGLAGVPFRRAQVLRTLQRIRRSVRVEWGGLLDGLSHGGSPEEGPSLGFTLFIGAKTVRLRDIATRGLYQALLAGVSRRPAAELTWSRIFPTHDTTCIWAHIFNWFTSPKVSDADFRFRHRNIFTCAILHHINPEEFGRGCPVCSDPYEDLEHLMVGCPVVGRFWTRIEDLLARRLGLSLPPPVAHGRSLGDSWSLLFGVSGRPGLNKPATDLVLSIARRAVMMTRNIFLRDHRTADHWSVFQGLLRAHISHLHTHSKERFLDFFLPQNTLVTVAQDGQLIFSF